MQRGTDMNELTALEQREGKHADKLSNWRQLYGRAVELATEAREVPPARFECVRSAIAAKRCELLGLDDALFKESMPIGVIEHQAAAARLTVDALTRSAIAAHLDLADRTLDGRENFRLLRRTLWAARFTLAVAAITLLASLITWRLDRIERNAVTRAQKATAVSRSAESRCEQETANGAVLPSCPGYRNGKFDPYKYLTDSSDRRP